MNARRFLKFVLLSVFTALLLVGCSKENMPETFNEKILKSMPPKAVLEVISEFRQQLDLSANEINLIDFEEMVWPDTCLGLSQEGETCIRKNTPGYQVKIEVKGNQYEFRSNQDGTFIIQANADIHTNFPNENNTQVDEMIPVTSDISVAIATGTPPTSYWTVFISENDQVMTFNCDGIELVVNGSDNTLTLLGTCPSLRVNGEGNVISIVPHPDLTITDTGSDNTIIEQSLD